MICDIQQQKGVSYAIEKFNRLDLIWHQTSECVGVEAGFVGGQHQWTYAQCCREAADCQEARVFRPAALSRRGAVSTADPCSWHSAQAEMPTHVKCHIANLLPVQARYNCGGKTQTQLIAPQNEVFGRLCNSQIYWTCMSKLSFGIMVLCRPLSSFQKYFLTNLLMRKGDCVSLIMWSNIEAGLSLGLKFVWT